MDAYLQYYVVRSVNIFNERPTDPSYEHDDDGDNGVCLCDFNLEHIKVYSIIYTTE